MAELFRPNVAAVVEDHSGRILIAQRADFPDCWQFPQGGIEPGETPEQAVVRELKEEVGLRRQDFRIIERIGPFRYQFPKGLSKSGFVGQEQFWFRVLLLAAPDVATADVAQPEFAAVRWIDPGDFQLIWLPEMKRPVVRKVLETFYAWQQPPAI
ncbi:MAG: RNA pyrophosphohydrolase [Verrucomicrobiia bacterium]